jgi:hypothetical protein
MVEESKILGSLASHHGIKANPSKVMAILEMESPKDNNEI